MHSDRQLTFYWPSLIHLPDVIKIISLPTYCVCYSKCREIYYFNQSVCLQMRVAVATDSPTNYLYVALTKECNTFFNQISLNASSPYSESILHAQKEQNENLFHMTHTPLLQFLRTRQNRRLMIEGQFRHEYSQRYDISEMVRGCPAVS